MVKRIAPIYSLALAVILQSSLPLLAHQAGFDTDKLDRLISQALKETNTPGMAVAIVRENRILLAKGFGVANVETGDPVTPDTLFQIGSVTKPFTAAALVRLAEEGKIKLDEPIGRYVQGLRPALSRLTAHQLLSQTSGLKDMPGDDGSHDESALAGFARALQDDDCLINPGEAFSYSNPGFALAGLVIQEIGGKSYADMMGDLLFNPLGMNRTTFRPMVAMTYPLAVGHTVSGETTAKVVRPLVDDTRLWPAGYIYSSAKDLSRFALALVNEGRVDGQQVLPSSLISKLSTPYSNIPTDIFKDSRYGYGLFIREYRGSRVIEHSGSMTGYSAKLGLIPNHRTAVVLLANNDGIRLDDLMDDIFEFLLPGKTAPSPISPQPAALPVSDEEMARYVGAYVNRWTVEIFVRDGRLFLKRFGAELPVTKIGEGRFTVQPAGAPEAQELRLVSAVDGQPEYLQMFIWAFKRAPTEPAQASPHPARSREDLIQLYDYDPTTPLDVKETLIRNQNGIKVYDLTYASPKEGRVTAFLVVPPGKGPFAGLALGHWGYGTRTEFLPEAILYAEAGAVSLMIDYPWVRPAPWRRSTRDLSEPETDREIYAQAVIDLRRGIDLLTSRSDVDANRIAYVGHSYGAQWGAILSAVDNRIKTAVLIGGVATQADIFLGSNDPDYVEFRKHTPKEQIDKYLEVNSVLDGIRYVPHAAPTPLLFQFARFERYFDEASMKRYAEAASEPKTVKWYDTGHELNDLQALLDRADWLRRHIGIVPLRSIIQKRLKKNP